MIATDTAQIGDTVAQRYVLQRRLGSGGQGVTYLATDQKTGASVVVKELDAGWIDDWKAVELFEREAEALAALDHPSVPAYIDAFELEQRRFLVREYIDGESFREMIERGYHMRESEAVALARSVLGVLDYLHQREPPVIHRDLKPANLIRRPDGRVALVDFGVAQLDNPDTIGGSTVVGTTGFVAPEQLGGRAEPRSDLYALGATLIYLLSHRHPSKLPVERLKLQFRGLTPVSSHLADLIDALIEPDPSRRPASARAVLVRLRADAGESALVRRRGGLTRLGPRDDVPALPQGGQLEVRRTPDRLIVDLDAEPRVWRRRLALRTAACLAATGAIALVGLPPVAILVGAVLTLFVVAGTLELRPRYTQIEVGDEEIALVPATRLDSRLVLAKRDFRGFFVESYTHHALLEEALCVDAQEASEGGRGWLNANAVVEFHLSFNERKWLLDVFGRDAEKSDSDPD